MDEVFVSVDAMGGDVGPEVTMIGLAAASATRPRARFLVYGDRSDINPFLARLPRLAQAVAEVVHTDVHVPVDGKPSTAVRTGRGVSGMWRAVEAVRDGRVRSCVSAGNTGALMAMAKLVLRTNVGIERPAIAVVWPTLGGRSVMLDAGATIGASPSQYVQLAIMGAAYARVSLGLQRPRVGLLNVGVEYVKGPDALREAAEFLKRSDMNFVGFLEGDGIGRGDADVVVTDGFTGNVAIKTAEGTSRQMATYLREALKRSVFSRIGAFLASGGIRSLMARVDPNAFNGGVFLGLNGIVVKSHGGTDADGFSAAVRLAVDLAARDMAGVVASDVAALRPLIDSSSAVS